ncbi:hypothetical protein [Streptomyces sp. NPDC006195]|uniref:hypothetical protein n=1 Tax=unclassified Streptomyces TaxID=2593676 RepID=UPI00339E2B56
MVQTLAVGEFQGDLQRELTYDGLRATEAKGNKGGRRPAIPSDKADGVRAAYLEGQFMVSLVRECDVSRGAIRTVVAGLLSVHMPADLGALAPELRSSGDVPGRVAGFLRAIDLEPVERAPLDRGVTVRRGQGYTLRVSATPAVHRQLLARCQPLDGMPGTSVVPAQCTACREYASRVRTHLGATAGP